MYVFSCSCPVWCWLWVGSMVLCVSDRVTHVAKSIIHLSQSCAGVVSGAQCVVFGDALVGGPAVVVWVVKVMWTLDCALWLS